MPWKPITIKQFLMGRQVEFPISTELAANAARLLSRVNDLLVDLPLDVRPPALAPLTSGYRPGRYNEAAGGAPNSAHKTCEAIDLADSGDKIDKYIDEHPALLETHLLWREDPGKTPGWVHLQTRPTKLRTFK